MQLVIEKSCTEKSNVAYCTSKFRNADGFFQKLFVVAHDSACLHVHKDHGCIPSEK